MSDQTIKPKWTPGPWVADIRSGCCAVYPKIRKGDTPGLSHDDDRNIYYSSQGAKYNGRHWEMGEEPKANARLIATAPEMAELLETAIALIEDDGIDKGSEEFQDLATDIAALLARAKGEGDD